jgi:hypothetical protein
MKRLFALTAMAGLMLIALSLPAQATNVTFNVNMSVQDGENVFDPSNDQVVVRGTFNGWGGNTHPLNEQGQGLYSATFDIAAGAIEYKFVIPRSGPDDIWENSGPTNRLATVGDVALDIPVVWFSNDSVISLLADVEVLFRVDLRVQQISGFFDPATDWAVVRGNHPNIGTWGGATRLDLEPGNPGVYSQRIQFDDIPVTPLEFKYVILHDGDVGDNTGWEQLPGNVNRSFTPTGDEPDNIPPPDGNGYGEINLPAVFWSDVDFSSIISHDLTVIFSVEINPLLGRLAAEGYVFDVQSGDTVYSVDRIDVAGAFNGWPWSNFSEDYRMLDNGVAPDLTAGDHVYTGQHLFPEGTARRLEYKYGGNMLDIEAGFARNHEQFLDDSQQTFRMSIDCWGSPDTLYNDWLCTISAADDGRGGLPDVFVLEQNYPNPFNPATTVNFTMTRSDVARLLVFDITGRLLSTNELGVVQPGRHTVRLDGSNWATGVYFYRLETPSHNVTKKMLLLK